MSTRPRTPQHFPKMKHRAAGRERRQMVRTVEFVLSIDYSGWQSAVSAAFENVGQVALLVGRSWQRAAETLGLAVDALSAEAPDHAEKTSAPVWPLPMLSATLPTIERNYAAYPFDEFIVDQNAPIVSANDLLTIACMDARHDSCEGDFCECACHDLEREEALAESESEEPA